MPRGEAGQKGMGRPLNEGLVLYCGLGALRGPRYSLGSTGEESVSWFGAC